MYACKLVVNICSDVPNAFYIMHLEESGCIRYIKHSMVYWYGWLFTCKTPTTQWRHNVHAIGVTAYAARGVFQLEQSKFTLSMFLFPIWRPPHIGDTIEFLSWLFNMLHKALCGGKKSADSESIATCICSCMYIRIK